jgi:hypothetical protein
VSLLQIELKEKGDSADARRLIDDLRNRVGDPARIATASSEAASSEIADAIQATRDGLRWSSSRCSRNPLLRHPDRS